MTKILVVDDEPDLEVLIKQKFRKEIRSKQYEFVFAENGRHALSQLDEHADVAVVLSDINMPEMDGLTLLSKINERQLLLKSVIVSAYGDMQNIRTAMNAGAFDFITKPIDFLDLSITVNKTIDHVSQLQRTMKALKENDILKMYVDSTVLNFMETREFEQAIAANESVEGTVAFVDIAGFTTISERQSPDAVVELLNDYFDCMVKAILAQQGTVDKFIGDAVMAVFTGEYHLDRAVDACLTIRDQIKSLPEKNGFQPSVSIGVNSGEMISGNIGSAELKRLDFTVIGDTVNVASRLQAVADEGQILINASCFDQIKESFNCKLVGEKKLRNKAEEQMVYEVID
ncbi:MAG: response regulator [Cyclobacteriaceae bacterium]